MRLRLLIRGAVPDEFGADWDPDCDAGGEFDVLACVFAVDEAGVVVDRGLVSGDSCPWTSTVLK